MPSRPPKPCTAPGCPALVTSGRCPVHQSEATRLRDDDYGPAWRRGITSYLRRHPTCVLCGERSEVRDHHPTDRRTLIAQGVADPDADHRLRPLCTGCHNAETAQHQPGGWHAEQLANRRSPAGR